MDRKSNITVARRMRGTDLKAYRTQIEKDEPDIVLQYRIDQAKTEGKSQQPDLNGAYEGMALIRPPFSMAIMVKLLDLDPYLAGAVEAIAANVSACEMDVQFTGGENEDKKVRKELEEFFFESNDPTNPMSLQEKLRACAIDFIALGSWNLEIIQGGERLMDMVHAPAEFVRVKKGMTGYVMIKDGEEVPFALYGDKNREKNMHQIIRAINKRPGHRVYGKPSTLSLVNTVLMNSLRDEKNLNWFDQGLLADLLVMIEESIGDDIKKQIIADYQNTSDGQQTMYLLDGVGKAVVRELKRSIEDESFQKMEINNRQRVLTALRVPPAKAAIYEDANRANTITQDETFRMEVVKPIQDTFRVRFNHLIRYGLKHEGWEFTIRPYSLKDRKEEAEILKTYIDAGINTVNEAREVLNMPPVKGGDRRVVNTPLGLVDIDTWSIAVADPNLAKQQAARLILRLAELRRELHECAA